MKHDETNFDGNAGNRSALDAELEARVVAWVAGESSAEEAAALERLAAANPAVREFQREMVAVQGLVVEGVRGESEPLRLAEDRRENLLATLSAPRAGAAPVALRERIATLPQQPSWWSWRGPRIYFMSSGLAAACLVGLFLYRAQGPELEEAKAMLQTVKSESVNLPAVVELSASMPVVDEADRRDLLSGGAGSAAGKRAAAPMATAPANADASSLVARDTGYLGRARLGPLEMQERATLNKALVAKERESVAFGSTATPLASPPSAPASTITPSDRSPLIWTNGVFNIAPTQTHNFAIPTAGAVTVDPGAPINTQGGLLLSTLTESPRVGADAPVKMDAFVVSEGRSGSAMAIASSANVQSIRGFNDLALSRSKDTVLAQGTIAGTGALNYTGGALSVTEAASITLGGTLPPPADGNNRTNGMVTVNMAPPVTSIAAVAEPAGKKASGQGQFAGNAAAAGSGFDRARAEARDDVIKLDAFTVSAPAKPKILSAIGGAVRSFLAPAPTGETATAQEPISTFSLHVSDVSFRLATAAVAAMVRGGNVTEPKIRAEEFYNAFDYGDPVPTTAEKIAARVEQSAHPFLQQRNLVRIGMKVAATGRGAGQPLRLTVLLDTSGSMEREDRAAAVRRALEVLVSLLGPNDRLTVIGFARQPRLLVENLAGDQARGALDMIARTPAEGGTNLEAALTLAGELARRHLTAGAQNRIVVLTDGAANLGSAEPARLTAAVETLRQQGIAFDACGVGLEGIGDTVLEALTRKGNGRYYALNSAETADASFARQLAGAFRPAAENVKLQVRFNPARVGRYRLMGFEEHRLKTEDFRNDAVDAAELAAEEGAVALYQVEVLPQGTGELGEVFVRFRDAATGEMVERSWNMPYEARATSFARATPSLRLAGIAALLSEKFLETPVADQFKLGDFADTVNALKREYPQQPRVQELVTMFNQVRQLTQE